MRLRLRLLRTPCPQVLRALSCKTQRSRPINSTTSNSSTSNSNTSNRMAHPISLSTLRPKCPNHLSRARVLSTARCGVLLIPISPMRKLPLSGSKSKLETSASLVFLRGLSCRPPYSALTRATVAQAPLPHRSRTKSDSCFPDGSRLGSADRHRP